MSVDYLFRQGIFLPMGGAKGGLFLKRRPLIQLMDDAMGKMNFGAYISWRRKQLGHTQKELADLLHYTPQAISRLESTEGSLSCDLIPVICSFLECSVDDLYLRGEETHPATDEAEFLTQDQLAARLSLIREAYRLNQEDLAAKIGISAKSLCNYEKGRQIPPFAVIELFCDYFHVLPSQILLASGDFPGEGRHSFKGKGLTLTLSILSLVAIGAGVGVPLIVRHNAMANAEPSTSQEQRSESRPGFAVTRPSSESDSSQQSTESSSESSE